MTASMAWPNFQLFMEERSPNRWQHRLKRERPTCTERQSLIKSADGRVATVVMRHRLGKTMIQFSCYRHGGRAVLAVKGSLAPHRTRP